MAGKKTEDCKTGRDERTKDHLKLTPKQSTFARAVASGMTYSTAYRHAYNPAQSTKASSISANACTLMKDTRITKLIEQITQAKQAAIVVGALSDVEIVRDKLKHFMEYGEPTDSVKLRAAELLGKAAGMFTTDLTINDQRERTTEQVQAELERRLLALTSHIDEDIERTDADTLQ